MGTHSISGIKAYQRSPNYWRFSTKLRRVPKRPVAVMRAGTEFHKWMERVLINPLKLSLDQITEEIGKEVSTAQKQWIVQNWPKEAEKLGKEWALLERLLPSWVARYPFETLATEVVLRAPLGKHTLVGTIDSLVRSGTMTLEMEHKSLSGSTPMDTYIEGMTTDIQRHAYWFLAEQNGYENWGGCYANCVRKLSVWSKTNCKACKGKLPQDCERCGGMGKEKLHEPQEAFVQEILPLNRALRSQLMDGVEKLMDEMDEMGGPRLPCPHSCRVGEFSNRLCPYYAVCHGTETIDNDFLFQTAEPRYEIA